MKTLQLFSRGLDTLPAQAAWMIAEISEVKGRMGKFGPHPPRRLRDLQAHAFAEAVLSSARLAGITVRPTRAQEVLYGIAPLKEPEEEQVRGLARALSMIIEQTHELDLGESLGRDLARLVLPEGQSETGPGAAELLCLWEVERARHRVHCLVLLCAFHLDFLCALPYPDGGGRVARLLLVLQALLDGYEVVRYISLDRIILDREAAFRKAWKQSRRGWEDGSHNPWPFLLFLLTCLRDACREFGERTSGGELPRGAKTQLVEEAIARAGDAFQLGEIVHACPDVSYDLVRVVIKRMRAKGELACSGRGPGSRWHKL